MDKKATNHTNTNGTKLNEIGTKEVTNEGKKLQKFSFDREMDKSQKRLQKEWANRLQTIQIPMERN